MRIPFTGWPAFGLFLAVFLTAYAPVLLTSYAFYDDFLNLAAALQGDLSVPGAAKIREGRPLLALLTNSISAARDIGDLRYLRFVGIIGIAVLAWSVFQILVRTGWSQGLSFFVCVIMCTTLPFQVYAVWAIAAFNLLAALASGWAFFLSEQAFEAHRSRPKWILTVGASLALLVALTIHQAAAMFFWVFAAVILLKPETSQHDVLRRFGWYCMIASVGMLLGFVVYKLGLVLYPGVAARTGLVQDIPFKAVWFLLEPLPNALNFAMLSPAHWFFSDGSPVLSSFHIGLNFLIAWSVLVLIVGGLMLHLRGTIKERLWKLGIAMSLLPLSYAPSLLVAENWASYRTLLGLTSIVVVYAFFAFQGYAHRLWRSLSPSWSNAGIGSVALASVLSAMYHVQTYFVAPQVQELEFMRSQLAEADISQVPGIYVIRPTRRNTLAPLVRYDEFGHPSSVSKWTPAPMVFLLLRDMAPDYAHLLISSVAADDPIEPPPNRLVVDMRKLSFQARRDDRGL